MSAYSSCGQLILQGLSGVGASRRPSNSLDLPASGTCSLPTSHGRGRDNMEPSLRVGQLAEATRVPVKTIRYYERVGVLPAPSRSPAGYREYDRRDIHRLLFIRRARFLGVPLAQLRDLTAGLQGAGCATMRPRLQRLVTEQGNADALRLRDKGQERNPSNYVQMINEGRKRERRNKSSRGNARIRACDLYGRHRAEIVSRGSPRPSSGSPWRRTRPPEFRVVWIHP